MQRTVILPVAALLILLPAFGCGKIQARAELKKGNSYYQQESYVKAISQYKEGLKLDPDATFAWRSLGLSALALYRPGDDSPQNVEYADTAINAFEKYLADYPKDEKVEEYLMSTLVNAKKYDDALAFIDRRSKEMPQEAPKLAKYRVTILTQAGRLDQAFQLASQLQGQEKAEALYSIGVSAWDKAYRDPSINIDEKTKIVDMGLQALKQALDVKPDYFEAMAYYSLLFREKAKVELDGNKRLEYTAQADEWLKKAVELRKKSQQTKQSPAKT
ncbi:MAG TPA: tetratricopeptide repeat protein [Thermoanaerobaculia bacterium]|nr:tetratricopeptide repeat protein [Thermoanaerobaculia bacterium]